MSHLQQESDVAAHQSAEYQFVGFDEVTHFTEKQYLYLGFSRMRSSHGIPLRLRAGTNPGGDGHDWVFRRFGAWLDPESKTTAEPGQVLYVRNVEGKDEYVPRGTPESFGRCFVPARVTDNPRISPDYAAGLSMLDPVTRAQLRDGDWLIRPGRGLFFKRDMFETVGHAPESQQRIRYWDRAGTGETEAFKRKSDPDFTAGLLMCKVGSIYYVEDVDHFRGSPGEVKARIVSVARTDGKSVQVGLEQDPGSAGKFEIAEYVTALDGFNVRAYPARQDKVTRAKPVSAQSDQHRVKLVRGSWNNEFLRELEAFPEGGHDDMVDAFSGAHNALAVEVLPSSVTRLRATPQRDTIFGDAGGW